MIDRSSADWPGLKEWLKAEIENRRDRLESPDLRSMADADQLRGEIKAFRGIIATVEPPPKPELVQTATVPGVGY